MFQVLLIIAVPSFCGGIVFGILSGKSNKLRLPLSGKLIELGFLGDALVGVAAAVSIFFIAGPLLNLKLDNLTHMEGQIKIISLSLLSGFAGVRVLTSMSSQLLDKLSAVDKRLDSFEDKESVDELIADGRFHMKNAEDAKESGIELSELEKALVAFEEALDIDRENEIATTEIAKVYRKMKKLNKAVSVLQEYVAINPKSARAYYNMACYKALLGLGKEKVVTDLEKAITLSGRYKRLVMLDNDFSKFHTDEDFKNLCK